MPSLHAGVPCHIVPVIEQGPVDGFALSTAHTTPEAVASLMAQFSHPRGVIAASLAFESAASIAFAVHHVPPVLPDGMCVPDCT
jgi:hypothetical protein